MPGSRLFWLVRANIRTIAIVWSIPRDDGTCGEGGLRGLDQTIGIHKDGKVDRYKTDLFCLCL